MAVVTANGAQLEYETRGDGSPVLFLHSLLTDRTAYDEILPAFARRQAVTPSLPGFGLSTVRAETVEEYAEQLAVLTDAGVLPPRADIVGNGLGSFIALALATRFGSRFNRLVLIGAGAAFTAEGKTSFRNMREAALSKGMVAVAETAIARLFPQEFILANPAVADRHRQILRGFHPEHFASACGALLAVDLTPALPAISNPVLIVVGTCDHATPVALGRELAARLPRACLVELRGQGHAPHIQSPQTLVQTIAGFLDLSI